MKAQGIQATQIAKYQYGAYQGHPIGYTVNNFDIQLGVGYSIKNNGDTKTFQVLNTPSPASFVCTACSADINKDKNVNITDFLYLNFVLVKNQKVNVLTQILMGMG